MSLLHLTFPYKALLNKLKQKWSETETEKKNWKYLLVSKRNWTNSKTIEIFTFTFLLFLILVFLSLLTLLDCFKCIVISKYSIWKLYKHHFCCTLKINRFNKCGYDEKDGFIKILIILSIINCLWLQ